VHEVCEVFPCEASILCEHHPQVCTSKRPSAFLTSFPPRLNVKLGGVNSVPEPRDISFLTDPANPTIVMGECLPALDTSQPHHPSRFVQVQMSFTLPLGREIALHSLPWSEASIRVPFAMSQRFKSRHLDRRSLMIWSPCLRCVSWLRPVGTLTE
jgi:hypothetical protein